jgi:hypothetical protein
MGAKFERLISKNEGRHMAEDFALGREGFSPPWKAHWATREAFSAADCCAHKALCDHGKVDKSRFWNFIHDTHLDDGFPLCLYSLSQMKRLWE